MRSKILKALAVISFGLVTFPFVFTNDVIAFENISPLRILAYYGGFSVIFLIGYAFARCSYNRKLLTVIMRAVGVLSFASGFIMLLWTNSLSIIFAVGTSSVLWYFLGVRACRKHYADIFPAFMFGVYIVVTLISYLFHGTIPVSELKEPVQSTVIIAFMIEMCLAALLINQSNIYDKANRRRETRTMLPKELSLFNAVLVLGVTLTGLLLYVFADEIIWAVKNIAFLIIKLFVLIMQGDVATSEVETGVGGTPEVGIVPSEPSVAGEILFLILLICAFLFIRKPAIKAIKNFIKSVIGFFVKETDKSLPEPEFVDIFENISYVRRKSRSLGYPELMKQYKSEKNPTKKYRIGYGILLKQLLFCKADIKRADTVTVQREKGREICGAELKNVTDCYNNLRYDDAQVTEADLSALDKLITDMNGIVKGRI